MRRIARVGIMPYDFLIVGVDNSLGTLSEGRSGVSNEGLDEWLNSLMMSADDALWKRSVSSPEEQRQQCRFQASQ
jgi:hypothetical protein